MNRSGSELKRIAKGNLNDKYKEPMRAYLLIILVSLVIQTPFTMFQTTTQTTLQFVIDIFVNYFISVIAAILGVGMIRMHFSLAKLENPSAAQIFGVFKGQTDRVAFVALVVTFAETIAYLPLTLLNRFISDLISKLGFNGLNFEVFETIPKEQISQYATIALSCGLLSLLLIVVVRLIFSMTYFVLVDEAELSGTEAFFKGISLLNGHRIRLFLLMLSFIGWDLLILLSFGLASLWIEPYRYQTFTMFYLDLVGKVPAEIPSQFHHHNIEQPQAYQPFDQYL